MTDEQWIMKTKTRTPHWDMCFFRWQLGKLDFGGEVNGVCLLPFTLTSIASLKEYSTMWQVYTVGRPKRGQQHTRQNALVNCQQLHGTGMRKPHQKKKTKKNKKQNFVYFQHPTPMCMWTKQQAIKLQWHGESRESWHVDTVLEA